MVAVELAPVVSLSPIPTISIVPADPLVELIASVVTGFVPPIVPCSWMAPDPLSSASASFCPFVPSIVPATVMPPADPDPVVNVVVPALLRTRFPVLNERSAPPVVIVGDTPVNRIVFPDFAS